MKRGFTHIMLLLIVTLLGIAGIGYFAYKNGRISKLNTVPAPIDPMTGEKGSLSGNNSSNTNITPTPTINNIDASNWKTYTNRKYGLVLKYPEDYEITLENDLGLFIRNPEIGRTISVNFHSFMSDSNNVDIKGSFLESASWHAMQQCASDYPGPEPASTYCDKVLDQDSFGNQYGYKVYKSYLNMIREKYNTPST